MRGIRRSWKGRNLKTKRKLRRFLGSRPEEQHRACLAGGVVLDVVHRGKRRVDVFAAKIRRLAETALSPRRGSRNGLAAAIYVEPG
jgi:hypothetical protein